MLTDCKIVGRDIKETFCLLLFNFTLFQSICLGWFIRHFLISFNFFCSLSFLVLAFVVITLCNGRFFPFITKDGTFPLSYWRYLFFRGIVDTVVACDRKSTGIVSSGKPQYHHVGEIVDGIDMRAEVALLSRNILIYGEMESSCYGKMCQFYSHDTFGGHVKVCTL